MSDSVRSHRWHSTRLHGPWDSLGKNTGVGCHFLLQCMKMKSEREVSQSCPTLRDPKDCSPPGSSIHGTFQARVLEWGAITFSKNKRLAVYFLDISSKDMGSHRVGHDWSNLAAAAKTERPAHSRYVLESPDLRIEEKNLALKNEKFLN